MSDASKRPHLCVLLGTRAQLIKMAPVMRELAARGQPYRLVLTGQHQETMPELLREFGLRPPERTLWSGGEIRSSAMMLLWLMRCLLLLLLRPGHWLGPRRRTIVLVHGDTMSTLLGALAARLSGRRVAHVEAGLRSHDWRNPFPEELTRRAVARLAHIAYCPGDWACRELSGHRSRRVDTGCNTIADSLKLALKASGDRSREQKPYFVVSTHRFENLKNAERLRFIVDLVLDLARETPARFVLHPVTRRALARHGHLDRLDRSAAIELLPRMGYTAFVRELAGARFVLTDGGSNQEELSLLGIRTVLLREASERPDGLGNNVLLSGFDRGRIERFLREPAVTSGTELQDLGTPSRLIVDDLLSDGPPVRHPESGTP